MIISSGPEISIETNISKESCFRDDRGFWPIFPGNIQRDTPHGTNYRGPQAI